MIFFEEHDGALADKVKEVGLVSLGVDFVVEGEVRGAEGGAE